VLHDKYVHGMLDSFLASPGNDEFAREFPGPPVKLDLPGGGVGVDVTLMAYHLHRVSVPHTHSPIPPNCAVPNSRAGDLREQLVHFGLAEHSGSVALSGFLSGTTTCAWCYAWKWLINEEAQPQPPFTQMFEKVSLEADVALSALELPLAVGNLTMWDQKLAVVGNHAWASPYVLSCGTLGHHSKGCQKLNDASVAGKRSPETSVRNEVKRAGFIESVSYRDSEWLRS
jgi:hypothetical protein